MICSGPTCWTRAVSFYCLPPYTTSHTLQFPVADATPLDLGCSVNTTTISIIGVTSVSTEWALSQKRLIRWLSFFMYANIVVYCKYFRGGSLQKMVLSNVHLSWKPCWISAAEAVKDKKTGFFYVFFLHINRSSLK